MKTFNKRLAAINKGDYSGMQPSALTQPQRQTRPTASIAVTKSMTEGDHTYLMDGILHRGYGYGYGYGEGEQGKLIGELGRMVCEPNTNYTFSEDAFRAMCSCWSRLPSGAIRRGRDKWRRDERAARQGNSDRGGQHVRTAQPKPRLANDSSPRHRRVVRARDGL
jgi:hypothetical protein